MNEKNPQPVWVVVFVQRGIIAVVEAYTTRTAATRRMRALEKDFNPNDDDLNVFEVIMNAASE
jgi:hypothetical protein